MRACMCMRFAQVIQKDQLVGQTKRLMSTHLVAFDDADLIELLHFLPHFHGPRVYATEMHAE